jgi:hypothetical protein
MHYHRAIHHWTETAREAAACRHRIVATHYLTILASRSGDAAATHERRTRAVLLLCGITPLCASSP